MSEIPTKCPICQGEILITRFECQSCETTFEGRFRQTAFAYLTAEQWQFVLTFIRCEGKIKSMEAVIGLSYPTIRNRLHEIIRVLGYEPYGVEEIQPTSSPEQRQRVLQALEKGEITVKDALRLLEEGGET
ncbi:MAG: DUF2089 domain-containing protein [Anaerolineales bacterium]|nr:DUF2089 domain-containing protein [Anaerolineales bacterium]